MSVKQRILAGLVAVLLLSAPLQAQQIATGSIGASGGVVVAQPPDNQGSLLVQVTGTWSAILTFEGSVDGSTFVALSATNVATAASAATTSSNGVFAVSGSGLRFFRLRATAYTSGTAVVTISAGPGGGAGGGGSSGSVTQGTSPWIVAGAGTAGAPGTAVLTVQGITSGTPVQVAPSSGTFATDGTFGSAFPSTGPGVGIRAETTTPSAAGDGQQVGPMGDVYGRAYTIPGADTNGIGATSGCALVSAASTNSTNCKASAGNFYGFRIVNTTATLYYLRMYNLASAPTCSSSTGWVESIPIPASTTGAGIVAINLHGENYSTGIGYCFTGGASSTDNTNAATGVYGRLFYK
jgi:hypothetical protein